MNNLIIQYDIKYEYEKECVNEKLYENILNYIKEKISNQTSIFTGEKIIAFKIRAKYYKNDRSNYFYKVKIKDINIVKEEHIKIPKIINLDEINPRMSVKDRIRILFKGKLSDKHLKSIKDSLIKGGF